MRWILLLAILLVTLGACQTPPERPALKMLPDDGQPVAYAELLTRARAQATLATEAFYVNKWGDLEDAARGLAQTARYLARAEDVPAQHKDSLPAVSGDLGAEADRLLKAARNRDDAATTESLRNVHVKVRQLRLDN